MLYMAMPKIGTERKREHGKDPNMTVRMFGMMVPSIGFTLFSGMLVPFVGFLLSFC